MFQRFVFKRAFSGGRGVCGRRPLPVFAFCLESQFPAKYSNWGFKKLMKMKTRKGPITISPPFTLFYCFLSLRHAVLGLNSRTILQMGGGFYAHFLHESWGKGKEGMGG